jgi:hypothetical protein
LYRGISPRCQNFKLSIFGIEVIFTHLIFNDFWKKNVFKIVFWFWSNISNWKFQTFFSKSLNFDYEHPKIINFEIPLRQMNWFFCDRRNSPVAGDIHLRVTIWKTNFYGYGLRYEFLIVLFCCLGSQMKRTLNPLKS